MSIFVFSHIHSSFIFFFTSSIDMETRLLVTLTCAYS